MSKTFWVTRNRRADVPPLPHPDGYDEHEEYTEVSNGLVIRGFRPTGRIKKTLPDGTVFIGTLEELNGRE